LKNNVLINYNKVYFMLEKRMWRSNIIIEESNSGAGKPFNLSILFCMAS